MGERDRSKRSSGDALASDFSKYHDVKNGIRE